MINEQYTKKAQNVLAYAKSEAERFRHRAIGTEHILLGLYREPDGLAYHALKDHLPEYQVVEEEVRFILGYGTDFNSSLKTTDRNENPYTPEAQRILRKSSELAQELQDPLVGTEHILLSMLEEDVMAVRILKNLTVDLAALDRKLRGLMSVGFPHKERMAQQRQGRSRPKKKAGTPTLDKVSRDLTAQAREGALDLVIERDQETRRSLQILSRRTKNNPVLVGEPGVGKTAIVEGLAQAIVRGDVPDNLANKRLLMLDMGVLIAGTKYRGEFEGRMTKILEEIAENGNIILFIDELHTIIGAGGAEGTMDASNILKPALARGEVQVIGATTLNEYQKYIERDAALERRFAKVQVEEPTVALTYKILQGLRPAYERYHQVKLTDEALHACCRLSERYVTDRFLPDKAIDVMDEASASKRLDAGLDPKKKAIHQAMKKEEQAILSLVQRLNETAKQGDFNQAKIYYDEKFECEARIKALQEDLDKTVKQQDQVLEVRVDDVAKVIAQWTGVPVSKLTEAEHQRLLHLEERLHRRVKGQDEAVKAVAKAVRRAQSGIKDPNRPIGSFIFLGPTGVGKTELARSLAEELFGSQKQLIRIDMSEFMEKYATSRMIGSAPGYVGYEEGGQLTEKVRRHPYSVILFDEIEKAHPDVFDLLLQILDDGYITDSKGRRVNFRNTIIIMTSNLGATALRDEKTVGFAKGEIYDDYDAMSKRIKEELKKKFRPEFLNRVDETLVFDHLKRKEVEAIVRKFADQLGKQLAEQGVGLRLTNGGAAAIAKAGFDAEYGARPIKRYIQRHLEDPLADSLLQGKIKAGDEVVIGARSGKLYIKVNNETGASYEACVADVTAAAVRA